MKVFETKKTQAQILKADIYRTDVEIDAKVYELYGLTEEEITILEQASIWLFRNENISTL